VPVSTVFDRDFEGVLLIANELGSKCTPFGAGKFLSCAAVVFAISAKRLLEHHGLSMRRNREITCKVGGKCIWFGINGMGWDWRRRAIDSAVRGGLAAR
jgi:hypothetical protein